ncbi:MAG: M14 family metallocarboxypeptidase [Clostridia bacterium]|nr:M14 family metallocarboxypeptidase [Clostridia bacterium]
MQIVPTNIQYTSGLTYKIAKKLCNKYPFLTCRSIGKSVLGKDILLLKVGCGERRAFFNASHHANEWITTPVLLKFIEQYCMAYANGEKICGIQARELFIHKTLFTVALVNPDGVDLVNGAIDKNSDAYKNAVSIADNYNQIKFPDGWKANIEGTDLNLNYPAGWGNAKRIKYEKGFNKPAPRDYVGACPLSAPESRAIYDLSLRSSFCLTLSYHTQGKIIYWKYLDFLPFNSLEIANKLSEASGYRLEVTPAESGYAGYKDWFISAFNRPGYTVEAGSGENPLPISQFDEIYSDNKNLLVTALNLA